jgi:hypothetical protein
VTDQRRADHTRNDRVDHARAHDALPSRDWILTDYFGTLTSEVSHPLDQLHNATNWGITLITAGVIAVVTRGGFPDDASFYILLTLLVVSTHFSMHGLKGYINVIRFGLLQRSVTAAALDSAPQEESIQLARLGDLIQKYHIEWGLPLKRRDVYFKGLLELGYGYTAVIILGLVIYCAISISFKVENWLAAALTLVLLCIQIIIFSRSPYMRNPVPEESARRQR